MSGGASSAHLVGPFRRANVTWQGVEQFEEYPDGRALMKEVGGDLKELDPYEHPRRPAVA